MSDSFCPVFLPSFITDLFVFLKSPSGLTSNYKLSLLQKRCFFFFFSNTDNVYFKACAGVGLGGKKIIEFVLNQQQSPVRRLQKSWLTNNHFNTGGSNPNTPPHFSVWSPTWGREASEAFFFFFHFFLGLKSLVWVLEIKHKSASRVLWAAALTGVSKLFWLSVRRLWFIFWNLIFI